MTSEISAAVAAIASVKAIAEGIISTTRAADRQQILIDFNSQIIEAQRAMFQAGADYEALARVKAELERKLLEMENWEKQAGRYELKELVPGIFVYAVKAGMEMGEPAHKLCPHCFQKRQRSILSLPGPGWTKYVCHECKFEAVFEERGPIAVSIPRRRRGLDG